MSKKPLGQRLKDLWSLTKEVYTNWDRHDPFTVSAALSYYAIFSLPAMLVVIVSIAGYFFAEEAITGTLFSQIKGLVGAEGAAQIQTMVRNAAINENSLLASIIALVTMLVSATGLFAQLQKTINNIWGLEPAPGKAVSKFLMSRVFSFGMIASIAFLLLISLVVSSLLTAFSDYLSRNFSWMVTVVATVTDIVVELGIYTLIFMVMYKVLPDAKVKWRTVRAGGVFTAILFQIGRWLIGFYLGQSNPGSTYGAAGSIILILLWVSYSSLILQAGAVYTKIIADRRGHDIQPNEYAVPTTRFYSSEEANKQEDAIKKADVEACQLRNVDGQVEQECK